MYTLRPLLGSSCVIKEKKTCSDLRENYINMLNNVLNPFYAPNRFLYPLQGATRIFQGRGVSLE